MGELFTQMGWPASPLGIALRTGIIYLAILGGMRVAGKRHVAQLSIIDLVLILLISNAVQNAMVGDDSTLGGGLVAAVTLFILNYVLTWLIYRFRGADAVLEGTPTLLIHNGRVIHEHLARERITEEELLRVIREHGIEHITDVKNAVMELDGTVSVVQKARETSIETFKRKWLRYRPPKP